MEQVQQDPVIEQVTIQRLEDGTLRWYRYNREADGALDIAELSPADAMGVGPQLDAGARRQPQVVLATGAARRGDRARGGGVDVRREREGVSAGGGDVSDGQEGEVPEETACTCTPETTTTTCGTTRIHDPYCGLFEGMRVDLDAGPAEWLHEGDVREAVAPLFHRGGPVVDEETEEREWAYARRQAEKLLTNVRRLRSHREEADVPWRGASMADYADE